jgi:hypothetical protein
MSSDLGAAAQRIRDVRAQVEAKKAEIAAQGRDDGGQGGAEESAYAGTTAATSATGTSAYAETAAPGSTATDDTPLT